MKKLVIILGMVMFMIGCGSSKPTYISKSTSDVMDGLFIFKFGMSVEDIKSKIDTTDWFIQNYKNEPITTEAFIEKYTLSYTYSIKGIKISFINDKLYEIRVGEYSKETEELLTTKYGTSRNKTKKYHDVELKTYAERTAEWDRIKSEVKGVTTEKEWCTNSEYVTCTSKKDENDAGKDSYLLEIKNDSIYSNGFRQSRGSHG